MKKIKKNKPPKKKHNRTKLRVGIMLIIMVASSVIPLVIYGFSAN